MIRFQWIISGSRQKWLAGSAFVFSALLASVGLSACGDSGSSTPGAGGQSTPIPRNGEAVFARYCNTCHPGGGRGAGPSLLTEDFSVDELKAVVRHGKTRMPGFGPSIISDEDLDALVSYVQGLKR